MKNSVLSSRDQPEQQQIVEQSVGEIADLLVEVHDHRVEGLGVGLEPDGVGDRLPVLVELGKLGVLQILVELALAQLALAPRLGDIGEVSIGGVLVTQPLGDEDLTRGVGQVLLGADDVGDPHLVVIDHTGQMVEAGPVGPLDDMILLPCPFELHLTPDQIGKPADPFAWHLEPHHSLSPLGLEPGLLFG